LVPHSLSPDDAWGLTWIDRGDCRELIKSLRYEGIYTPPSLGAGTLMFPGNGGGSNWGGVAVDPTRRLLVANVMNLPFVVALVPRDEVAAERRRNPYIEMGGQEGTPYAATRKRLMSPWELPCNPPPWGSLAAVDLNTGDIVWQEPLGTVRDLAPVPLPIKFGVPNLGGPLVTSSGLIFVGATLDDYIRAFDVETGEELWKGRLPAGGQATPMTYRIRPDSRQFVVIAAGGHGRGGTTLGDSLMAYALPQ
jgi:quinoprotein glucose dehydrogenase